MLPKPGFTEVVFYSIALAGEIPEDIAAVLPNFYTGKLVYNHHDNITNLKGFIKDQSALVSLLNYLSDLHYVILSVNSDSMEYIG